MNPFICPERILISRRPQDMRYGICRLSAIIAAEFGRDPMDGALYVFVSRDLTKAKLLRFDVNGWALIYCTLAEGTFKLSRPKDAPPLVELAQRELFWLLDGLSIEEQKVPPPVTPGIVL